MRTSEKKINKYLRNEVEKLFAKAIADMNTKEKVLIFLKDFLTETEFEALVKRLAIAYYLSKGRSYQNIKENLKVSSATIASVQEVAEKKGIAYAVKLIQADEWAEKWSERIKSFVKTKE